LGRCASRRVTRSLTDLVRQRRLANRLHKHFVISIRNRESAQIQRVDSAGNIRQRHQVLAIIADVHRVVVNRILIAADVPLQRICRCRSRNRQTVIDPRFYFRSLFIIVPRHQLKIGKRFPRVIHAVDLGECLQPRLPALLIHNAVRSPGGQRVVKAFISRSNSSFLRIRQARLIEAGQIVHPIIAGPGHYPRVTAIGKHVGEAIVILKDKCGMRAQCRRRRRPVNRRIGKVHIEICNHGLTLYGHVSRRRKVGVLHVLQFAHQFLLRRTTRAVRARNRSRIDHDREGESGMSFRLRHHQLRRLVRSIVRPIPIDDHSINAAADQIINLVLHLRRIGRTVTHIHVARPPKPTHEMGVNLRRSAGIKQRVNVQLAYVACAAIVIRLCLESVCRAGIVRGLSRECRGGYYVRRAGQRQSRREQRDCECREFAMHRSSGRT
jgi:hypothetical protein